jgi:hypothetical protein
VALGSDFRRLRAAYAISETGTGLAYGAIPLVAVLVLKVPPFQVSLLAALGGIAAAVLALPAGPWIEFRRKRPVMIGAEPAPPPRVATTFTGKLSEIGDGWRYLVKHPGMRTLFVNPQIFGAAVMATAPLLNVLMLARLHFPPWQYGLAMGLPCLGGIIGALGLKPLNRRCGEHRILLISGVFRALWIPLLAFVPSGVPRLLLIIAIETLGLLGSGVLNPSFATYRMTSTDDGYLSRVIACWSISSRTAQPIGIVLGGAPAAVTSVRVALLGCGLIVLSSGGILPWRKINEDRQRPALISGTSRESSRNPSP